jgi:exo-beta-1,3-glucanase (GH17 family)
MMKEKILNLAVFILLVGSQASFGYGEFFSPGTTGMAFNIKTATAPANYPKAGLRITSGHKLFCPGLIGSKGHCIFSVNHNSPHNTIGFQGPQGPVTVELCLNGIGQASCRPYTLRASSIHGINYDPAHSSAYLSAQSSNNQPAMQSAMNSDFQQIKNNGFTVVKTFISVASTFDGQTTNLAGIACPMGLQLMLGVYEFTPADGCSDNSQCASWTQTQVQNAISSVQNNQGCIVGIVVGNEDIYDYSFTVPNTQVQQRIATDINTIKTALGSSVPVGTAQQDGALLALAGNDQYGIIPLLDFVGANIYPYWSSQQPSVAQSLASNEFANRLAAVRNAYPSKVVKVTEEGWPSNYNPPQNPNATLPEEIAYYTYWLGRQSQDTFDDYYFSFYDKQHPPGGGANEYFGLCNNDGTQKSSSLFPCTA